MSITDHPLVFGIPQLVTFHLKVESLEHKEFISLLISTLPEVASNQEALLDQTHWSMRIYNKFFISEETHTKPAEV